MECGECTSTGLPVKLPISGHLWDQAQLSGYGRCLLAEVRLYLQDFRRNRLPAQAHLMKTSKTYIFSESLLITESIFVFITIQKVNVLLILKQEAGFTAYPKSGSFPCQDYLSDVRDIENVPSHTGFSSTSKVQCK